MTVESQVNKTEAMVMGSSATYDFSFHVLLNDPTENEAKQAIKVSISDGVTTTQLEYGTDYTVSLNDDGNGGTVTVADVKTSDYSLIIYREYDFKQGSDYQNYNSFPADTLESNLDKNVMVAQQLNEKLDRAVTVDLFSGTKPAELIEKVEVLYEIKDSLVTDAQNAAAISAVAANETNINAVNANKANIDTVAGNSAAINTAAENIAAIIDAPNQAAAAATSAETAASYAATANIDASAAQNSATASAASAEQSALSQTASANSEAAAKQSELKAAVYAERVRSEGIPMSIIEQKRVSIDEDGRTVRLWWKDPRDTIIDGYVIASWAATVIVKKEGTYPEDIDDGEIVATVTDRDSHIDDALVDVQEDAANWKYRAFPRTVNGVYCLDKRNCFGVWVYGYYIDEAAPVTSTRVHKIEGCDNYFYERAYMDYENDKFEWGDWKTAPFLPKPCMLRRNGEVAYYLNENDYTKKADGTASDVSNTAFDGNAMMEWNTVFMKKYRDRNRIYVFFSNVKHDSGYECYSTKKTDGTYGEHFYTPIYEGNIVSNVMRSLSLNATAQSGTTAEQEAAYAEANGAGWTTTVWADEDLITALFVMMFENTDSQAALGNGNINGGTSAASFLPTGSGNQKGMFWGSNGTGSCVKVFGMENFWGNRWRRPNGVLLINGVYHVKMTRTTADGSTVTGYNRTGTGYINTGLTTEGDYNAAYISRVHAGKYGFLVAKATGSSTTFYADGHWSARTGTTMLLRGGLCSDGALGGAFASSVSSAPADAAWTLGSSLSYRNS